VDLVSRLKLIRGPSGAPESDGGVALSHPSLDDPIVIHDLEIEPRVRIHQTKFRDDARDFDYSIELVMSRGIVVRRGGRGS
jgi:hypothetical protein